MVRSRCGHSLAELMVALALLGAGLAGAASAAMLGYRSAAQAVMRQQALDLAAVALDSLVRLPDGPTAGGLVQREPGWSVAWQAEPVPGECAARIRVTVMGAADARPLAWLDGLWIAPVPGPLP